MTSGEEAHGGGDGEDDRDGRRGRGRADLLRGVRRHDDPHLLMKYSGRKKGCQKLHFFSAFAKIILPNLTK